MMKHYAKKREPHCAVQWNGKMTSDVTELVGQRKIFINGDQLVFANEGPGRFARVGDWIMSTPSGEDLTVIGDEMFRKIYEEVDEVGHTLPPTSDEHEAAAQTLIRELDVLLVAGVRLSREEHPAIFRDRDSILRKFRHLLEDHAWTAARRERQRVRDMLVKELAP